MSAVKAIMIVSIAKENNTYIYLKKKYVTSLSTFYRISNFGPLSLTDRRPVSIVATL